MLKHVFVISLQDATERRAPLVESLTAMGIAHEVFWAVDGRSGLSPDHEARIDRDAATKTMGRPMSDAEFGCALSHQDIYHAVIARDLDHALILEDDAILMPGFDVLVNNFQLDDYDLLLLDHWRARVHRRGRKDAGGRKFAYRAATTPYLTTGYVISNAGAQEMVAQSTPLASTADWPCDILRMQTYAIHPRLVDHPDRESGTSDIRTERKIYQATRPKKKKETARRFLKGWYWKRTYYKRLGKWIS